LHWRTTFLAVFGGLILWGLGLAGAGEYSLLPDSTIVGRNYGYPSGTPGQGPTPPGNLDVVFEALLFAKNLELSGYPDDSVSGETYIGFLSPLRLRYRAVEEVTVEAGAILGHNFGDDNQLDVTDPLLRLVYQPNPHNVIVGGTLLNTHWIHDALYDDVHLFRRPAEQGFQYRADAEWLKEDLWIDWRVRETETRPEEFDVADSTQLRWGNLWLDGQFLWAHMGGQNNLEDRVANNGNCLLGGSYGLKLPVLGGGELRFGTYYLTGFEKENDGLGIPTTHGSGYEFRLWYDMQPTPQSMLRVFGSSYQGHGLVAWLGDPLYRKDSYVQTGFDLLLWLRGNFRMEWGFEAQWVDGVFMNSYQVNFVWGESFHGLPRHHMFANDLPFMPPEQLPPPQEMRYVPPPTALPPPTPGQWPIPPATAPLTPAPEVLPPPLGEPPPEGALPPGAVPTRTGFPLSARPGVGEAPAGRQVSYEEKLNPGVWPAEPPQASQPAVQPVGDFEPLHRTQPEPRLLSRTSGMTDAVVSAANAPPVRLPPVTMDATGPPILNVEWQISPDQPTLPSEDGVKNSFSIPIGKESLVLESLPQKQLWRVPMANQREPRCFVKLTSLYSRATVDTGIGAVFGLERLGPADNPREGIELGVSAAVFTRFLDEGHPPSLKGLWVRPLTAADYRVGLPLMLAHDDWQMKLSYEHTSCHLGDEYMLLGYNYGISASQEMPVRAVRDEGVLGIARFFGEAVRLYGQFGYSFTSGDTLAGKTPARFDWGLEYSPPAPPRGGPFAAFDMDLRAEQNFYRNLTVQAGWQWKTNENRRSSARIGAEYYDGRSPYGQFEDLHESYWGFVAIYDW
jgi:hypothetical protein